jgi:hypothetical protein
MKTFLLSLSATAFLTIAAASVASPPAVAEVEYPWCSRSSTAQGGGPSCRYTSYEQCQANVASTNGWCERNARIVWQEQQQGQKRGAR